MAKISQASSKYIIHAKIEIDGVVDRPDVVGAIFGQIEGLLGADLELRELQRSGRIGRIEVQVSSKGGKTSGTIDIPSSLDKAETAIVAGALEIIERIGPCGANIQVTDIEDERIAKRQQVINRAKQLLKRLNDSTLPDSGELAGEVSDSVKREDIVTFGKEKLAAGPHVAKEKEVIFVEGRADVITLLRHGFKNAISVNGTSVPDEIKKLSKEKEVTILCDGDRGGDLIIKELIATCKIDYVTKAPDGKEVEELQKKEIHQALRSRVKAADWGKKGRSKKSDSKSKKSDSKNTSKKSDSKKSTKSTSDSKKSTKQSSNESSKKPAPKLSDAEKTKYKKLLKDLKKNEVYVLDKKNNVLGKVKVSDIADVLPNLDGVSAVVVNGEIDAKSASAVDKSGARHAVAKKAERLRCGLITPEDLK